MSGVLNISELHWEEQWIDICFKCARVFELPSLSGYRVCCGRLTERELRRTLVTDVGRSGAWEGLFESERTLNE